MNDPTPLHDDALDEGLRAALLQIDRGPELTVDVDEVLRRGARHRRLVVLERVGAVAAVALVVVGAGTFALTRTTPLSAPVAPATSVSPSVVPTRSVEGSVAPSMLDGSSAVTGDPKLRRGLAAIKISNIGTEATTVTLGEITASGAPVKAVLVQLPASQQNGLTIDDALLSSVDRPGPASVTVPAGQHAILVMSVTVPTCPSSLSGVNELADTISSSVTLSLRTASGGTGTLDVTHADGTSGGWVRVGLRYACGFAPKT
jgi:hypothetical protein